ncbi:MAG: flagellar biosynthetic protein FliQ [Rhizobiales bacterium 65-9]|nr:flagellar biosynthesis protein FliQ [Hyphomicrobiales bacterium]OJY34320.1 MAG: flagellar biosynthetic protein FliQ [Rhizobiales bacterium 65-9]
MNGGEVIDVARDAIITFLKVGGPLLVVTLIVGVAVSLLQALTQIQEQTLIFVPKILALAAALVFAMPFMGDAMASYMARIATRIAGGG